MLFSMQRAMKSACIWLPWPLTISKRYFNNALSRVCGSITSFNHCNFSSFDVQPFLLIPKCQFLDILGDIQPELKCFFIIIGRSASPAALICLILIIYFYLLTIYFILNWLFINTSILVFWLLFIPNSDSFIF